MLGENRVHTHYGGQSEPLLFKRTLTKTDWHFLTTARIKAEWLHGAARGTRQAMLWKATWSPKQAIRREITDCQLTERTIPNASSSFSRCSTFLLSTVHRLVFHFRHKSKHWENEGLCSDVAAIWCIDGHKIRCWRCQGVEEMGIDRRGIHPRSIFSQLRDLTSQSVVEGRVPAEDDFGTF